jgi:hypothetical protein
MRHSIADFDAGPKSASEKFEVAFAVVADRGRTRGRRVSYVAGSTPGRRSLHTLEPLAYCADWLLADGWFSSCCNCNSWRSCSTLAELDVGTLRGLGCREV